MHKISVLLPVKNCETYILECVESVLNQSYPNFELLIIDDYSTDNTLTIIKKIVDNRIKIIQNQGFVDNLNLGIEKSSGSFIARMDADDIMGINRLAMQLEIMKSYPDVVVCSTEVKLISTDYVVNDIPFKEHLRGIIKDPLALMMHGNIVIHPTVMLRKDFLIKNSLKYQDYQYAEDYKLWFEIAKNGGLFYTIPENLLFYRLSKNQVSSVFSKEMRQMGIVIKKEVIEHVILQNRIITNSDMLHLFRNQVLLYHDSFITFESISSFYFNLLYDK